MPYSQLLPPGPSDRGNPRRTISQAAAMAAVCAVLVGCGTPSSVERYQIPKPEWLYATNHVDRSASSTGRDTSDAEPTDRLRDDFQRGGLDNAARGGGETQPVKTPAEDHP